MNPIIALIIAYIIWGAAAPITKLALQDVPPFLFGFLRFFFAGSIYLIFVLKKWQQISRVTYYHIIAGALFGVVVNKAFFFLGLQQAPSVYAPVIGSLSPLLLYGASVLFLKEKQNKSILMGICIAFIGLVIIVVSPLASHISPLQWKSTLVGCLFLFCSVLASVAQTLVHKKVLLSVDALQVTFISFLVGAITFLPFALVELNTWSFYELTPGGILGIVYGIVFGSAVAYGLFMYGISRLRTQRLGVFSYISPVVAILVSYPLLGESPNWYFYIGALLIGLGMSYAEHMHATHVMHKL